MQYIDLTHTFDEKLPVYPGDLEPELTQSASLESDGYNEYTLKTGLHVGTHMDAPLHMIEGGKRLSEYPAEHLIGPGYLIDARGKTKIDVELFEQTHSLKHSIVLVMTGFNQYYREPRYYEAFPEFTLNFAQKLIDLGVKIVGSDTPSPDREPFAVHKLLLAKDILIIENLTNLELLVDTPNFEVIALPMKLRSEAAPVRVIAQVS